MRLHEAPVEVEFDGDFRLADEAVSFFVEEFEEGVGFGCLGGFGSGGFVDDSGRVPGDVFWGEVGELDSDPFEECGGPGDFFEEGLYGVGGGEVGVVG